MKVSRRHMLGLLAGTAIVPLPEPSATLPPNTMLINLETYCQLMGMSRETYDATRGGFIPPEA